jgi:hypothetical protein
LTAAAISLAVNSLSGVAMEFSAVN